MHQLRNSGLADNRCQRFVGSINVEETLRKNCAIKHSTQDSERQGCQLQFTKVTFLLEALVTDKPNSQPALARLFGRIYRWPLTNFEGRAYRKPIQKLDAKASENTTFRFLYFTMPSSNRAAVMVDDRPEFTLIIKKLKSISTAENANFPTSCHTIKFKDAYKMKTSETTVFIPTYYILFCLPGNMFRA